VGKELFDLAALQKSEQKVGKTRKFVAFCAQFCNQA